MYDQPEGNPLNRAASKLAEMPRGQTQGPMAGECAAGRQTSKTLLLDHAERLRRTANEVEALAYAIEHVRGDAEGTLYRLLSGDIHRR